MHTERILGHLCLIRPMAGQSVPEEMKSEKRKAENLQDFNSKIPRGEVRCFALFSSSYSHPFHFNQGWGTKLPCQVLPGRQTSVSTMPSLLCSRPAVTHGIAIFKVRNSRLESPKDLCQPGEQLPH